MAYKTFNVRGNIQGWGCDTGYQLTLFGRFGLGAARSFRSKEILVLHTQANIRHLSGDEYLYVQVDDARFADIVKTIDTMSKDGYARLQVCLEGKGLTNNRVAYATVVYPD